MKKQALAIPILSLALPSLSMGALVAWYPLDSDASDASGNGHHGSVVGGTVNFGQAGANGATGSSAAFPDNGHIDVPFSSSLNPGSFTVTLWANAASTTGFASPITSRDDVPDPGGSVHGFILYNDINGNWNFWTGTGGPSGAWNQQVGPAVSVSQWTHLALTFDSGTNTKKFWVNGTEVATATGPALYSPNGTVQAENLHIGSGSDNGDNFYFSGNIDDVSIWDEALNQAAIQNIIDNGVASIPEPSSLGLLGLAGLAFLRRRR